MARVNTETVKQDLEVIMQDFYFQTNQHLSMR